jgi:hypothetical protein
MEVSFSLVSAVREPQADKDQPPASTEVSIDIPRKKFVFWLSKNPSKPISNPNRSMGKTREFIRPE